MKNKITQSISEDFREFVRETIEKGCRMTNDGRINEIASLLEGVEIKAERYAREMESATSEISDQDKVLISRCYLSMNAEQLATALSVLPEPVTMRADKFLKKLEKNSFDDRDYVILRDYLIRERW